MNSGLRINETIRTPAGCLSGTTETVRHLQQMGAGGGHQPEASWGEDKPDRRGDDQEGRGPEGAAARSGASRAIAQLAEEKVWHSLQSYPLSSTCLLWTLVKSPVLGPWHPSHSGSPLAQV